MNGLLLSFALFLGASLLSAFLKENRPRRDVACGGVAAGALAGLVPSLQVLQGAGPYETVDLGSPIPGLEISLGIDPLTAFFLVAILGLSLLSSLYGREYVKNRPRLLKSLPFFPFLVLSMALVVTARDGFFFLIVWEIMSLSSFFLVITEHEVREVRHAGWIYLIFTHLATSFLLVFFLLLSAKSGSFSFGGFGKIGPLPPLFQGVLFILALVGFGTKAGIFPLHLWLPHAHSAAPSYISALMSGVMIKTGIYGILRALTFLGPPPLWFGEVLMGLGIVSAVLGVLYALMQHDLKRLLAYHSVENIGLIVTGIGLGTLGIGWNSPAVILLGFGGALFHVWNHALFKGLLFLGAGSVAHETHTRLLDHLGGLLKKMPLTGCTFIVGAAAICGLPPLNGFISEWLIYLGLFHQIQNSFGLSLFFAVTAVVGFAFAGGLAVACFTKVVGVVFLGEPRKPDTANVHESKWGMLLPMVILSLLCAGIGLFPLEIWNRITPVVAQISPHATDGVGPAVSSLRWIAAIFGLLLGFSAFLIFCHRYLFERRPIRKDVTWDCGYASPTTRMQYTASSFAEPLGAIFGPLLRQHRQLREVSGYFPGPAGFEEHTEDLAKERIFNPVFGKMEELFRRIRGFQRGRTQEYLACIFITLILLLLWEVWLGI